MIEGPEATYIAGRMASVHLAIKREDGVDIQAREGSRGELLRAAQPTVVDDAHVGAHLLTEDVGEEVAHTILMRPHQGFRRVERV